MDIYEVIFLAIIQGITEFLPISSSAHLILPSKILGFEDQGLAFDVAVHFGSLFAVLTYFRQEVIQLIQAWTLSITKKQHTSESRLAWYIALATMPAVFAGFVIDVLDIQMRSILVIATTTLVFGIVLGFADKRSVKASRTEVQMNDALFIGLAQCLALVPGTSRSGITMTMALFLGISREQAARFSFLLSIPLIIAATVLKTYDLLQFDGEVAWDMIFVGTVLSFATAYACITLFLKWIEKMGFMPFVIYRVILGLVLYGIYFTA